VSATGIIFMVSFIPFLIFFLLSWKDHIRRTSVSIFGAPNRVAAERTLDGITLVIRAFVFGNVLIGIALSLASGLFFWLMKLPYPAIMGPVSGFLSLVPYLGPLLAAVLPVLTALGEFNTLSPAIVVLGGVIGLHILALNLLYPKLIGSRVHLNPVVVTLALMFWGWLWGAMGLVLAIPITASVKAVCDNVPSLKPYGRLMAD
jgi:predicted PurR-regulated permease PerM